MQTVSTEWINKYTEFNNFPLSDIFLSHTSYSEWKSETESRWKPSAEKNILIYNGNMKHFNEEIHHFCFVTSILPIKLWSSRWGEYVTGMVETINDYKVITGN